MIIAFHSTENACRHAMLSYTNVARHIYTDTHTHMLAHTLPPPLVLAVVVCVFVFYTYEQCIPLPRLFQSLTAEIQAHHEMEEDSYQQPPLLLLSPTLALKAILLRDLKCEPARITADGPTSSLSVSPLTVETQAHPSMPSGFSQPRH